MYVFVLSRCVPSEFVSRARTSYTHVARPIPSRGPVMFLLPFHRRRFRSCFFFNLILLSVFQVFAKVTAKLESMPGLSDRVQLFLMGDPTPLSPEEVLNVQLARKLNMGQKSCCWRFCLGPTLFPLNSRALKAFLIHRRAP